jgi:hypothetical protein
MKKSLFDTDIFSSLYQTLTKACSNGTGGTRLAMKTVKTALGLLTAGLFGLAVLYSFDVTAAWPWLRSLSRSLFVPLAPLSLLFSISAAAVCFREIVRRYRKISGFPWLSSLGFAAAAMTAIVALHAFLPG